MSCNGCPTFLFYKDWFQVLSKKEPFLFLISLRLNHKSSLQKYPFRHKLLTVDG